MTSQLLEVVQRRLADRGLGLGDMERMRKLAERLPYPPVLLRYALAAGINGQPEEARLALVRLFKMSEPARCDEGRVAWRDMAQGSYPELARVPFPDKDPLKPASFSQPSR